MTDKDIEYIRVAAYYIWENEGRPEGRAEEFFCRAANNIKKKAVAKKPAAKKVAAAKPAAKAAPAAKKPAAPQKAAVKPAAKPAVKINPVPVKSASAKIITPLYGSAKK